MEELEAQATLRHQAWLAATILAPETGLEIGGEGKRQGHSEAGCFFAVAIHPDVEEADASLSSSGGGAALFGNVDGSRCCANAL